MPYRRLAEAGRARSQFDQILDRRLRALERRSRYPGAMRVVEADDITVTTGTTGVYLTMNVDQGSWMIHGGLNLHFTPTNNALESATVLIRAYGETEGELPAIGPPAFWIHRGIASTGLRQPFTLFGHGHFTEPVRLDLYVAVGVSGAAHAVEIESPCLQASPV